MIKLVDRYIGLAALQGTLTVWVGLTLLYVMISALAEIRETGGGYGLGDAMWYVTLTTPVMAYQIFPFAALLGVLVGVGSLAASNELVAFRSSGASRMRLSLAALGGVVVLLVPVTIMGEWVASPAEHQARAFRLGEQENRAILGGARGMWLRDGRDIVNIQLPLLSADRSGQTVEFRDIVIYGFSELSRLESITRARSANHEGSAWSLEGVSTVRFEGESAVESRSESQVWPTQVRPELLDSAITRPARLSMRALLEFIDYLGENGLDDRVYRSAFWLKAFYPLTILALVLAGMPFVFGSSRSQSLGVRMFVGMMLGGLFMILNRGVLNFGEAYALPAMLINLVPPLLLGTGAVLVLRRTV